MTHKLPSAIVLPSAEVPSFQGTSSLLEFVSQASMRPNWETRTFRSFDAASAVTSMLSQANSLSDAVGLEVRRADKGLPIERLALR